MPEDIPTGNIVMLFTIMDVGDARLDSAVFLDNLRWSDSPECSNGIITPTPTDTFTPSNTPTSTHTPTNTSTWTHTPTLTDTPTNTFTPSNTPTSTHTPTNTSTWTHTPTNTLTDTPSMAPALLGCQKNHPDRVDCSSIEVIGHCSYMDGVSTAIFVITNTGEPGEGDVVVPSEYRIYMRSTLVLTEPFQLAGGESLTVIYDAHFGDTVRLEADQQPGHPGKSRPNATVECRA